MGPTGELNQPQALDSGTLFPRDGTSWQRGGDDKEQERNGLDTSGSSTFENLTTSQKITTPYTSEHELCQSDAEWIIDFGGDAQTFVNFGSWNIYNTEARGSLNDVTASGATIAEITADAVTKTSCSTTNAG